MSDYYTENPESFRGHQLTFSHLSVLRNKRDILKDVSGAANPGEILAVMGPSGSGKTTLLSVLAGRLSPGRGELTLNGKSLDKHLRRRISFVLQEDAYLCNLTCWETLWYTALLRLPGSIPTHKKKEIVSDVVDALDMRQCLNTKIGNEYIRGISGGEKRKLSIACELLTNPVLMLLDEPTSGLDSSAAHSFCSKIQKVAKSANKTVVMSIHQPSSQLFNMFEKLLLICEGQVAYYGEAKKCAQYFAALGLPCPTNYNIADHILDQVKSSEDVKRKILRHAANQLKSEITEAGELKNGTADLTEDEGDGYQKLIATPHEESKKATCSRTSVPSESSWSVLNETTTKKLTRSNRVKVYVKEQLAKLEDVKTGLVDQVRTCGADMLPEVEGQICKHTNEFKEKWPTSFAAQHSVLFRRCLKQTCPRVLSKWNVLQMIIIGIFAGILWFQTKAVESEIGNRKGLIFFCIICTSFCCLLDSTISVFSDRAVLNKERVSGYYRLSAYYIAKNVSGIPVMLILPSILFTIVFWSTGLNRQFAVYAQLTLLLYLSCIVANSVGEFVGTICQHANVAVVGSTTVMVLTMISGGFYTSHLPHHVDWLKFLSYVTHVYHSALIIDFSNSVFKCSETQSTYNSCTSQNNVSHSFSNASQIVSALTISKNELMQVHTLLGQGWTIGYHLLVLIGLVFSLKMVTYQVLRLATKSKS